ncbi:MAG: orotate phosphoribosyltransferase, partial [Gammaproteobacteria bacterium]
DAIKPSEHSATQDVARLYGIPVIAIASLADLLAFLESGGAEAQALAEYKPQVQTYRERYGV